MKNVLFLTLVFVIGGIYATEADVTEQVTTEVVKEQVAEVVADAQ